MEIRIFQEGSISDYAAFLKRHKLDLDVFYLPNFLSADAKMQKGKFEVFTVSDGHSVFVYPYILAPIFVDQIEHFDVCAPYGYCGPFATDEGVFALGEKYFLEHSRKHNFVSQFIRYHFIYNETFRFNESCTNELNRDIVTLDLKKTWEQILENDLNHSNRNILRRYEKDGFEFKIVRSEAALEEFIVMYEETMRNAAATQFYFFDHDYYKNLFHGLEKELVIARVEKEGVLYSTALFFQSGGFLSYFLSSRNTAFPKISGNNFLLGKMIEYGVRNKFSFMNFGGGRTTNEDDALFKFKRSFSSETKPFYVGKRILNEKAYQWLKNDFIEKHGQEVYAKKCSQIQFYRN